MKTLKPFQEIGARFLAANPHALLADEPGLGKTLQAIDGAARVSSHRNLVVCPASVRDGWRKEIQEYNFGGVWDWEIRSYNEVAAGRVPIGSWDTLILDEVHFLKSMDSQRTRSVFGNRKKGIEGLARRAHNIWGLTGTPVLNRPVELYPILKTLGSRHIKPYDNFKAFTQQFCGAYFDGYGTNVKGATNLDDLARRLRGFMLRRTKRDVLPELPAKIVRRVVVEPLQSDLDAILEEETRIGDRDQYLSTVHENFAQLGDLARLRRLTGLAKIHPVAAYVDELLETVDKVVIFAWHREVIQRLLEALGGKGRNGVVYWGGMTDANKTHNIQIFKNAPAVRVFIGQIGAAGTGINGLQEASSDVVFAEIDWTPGVMGQAIDRLHRIGQTSVVNVHVPYAPGTLESAVLAVNERKAGVIERLVGEGAAW